MTNTVTQFKGIGKFALACLGLTAAFCGIIAGQTGGILYRQTRIDNKLDDLVAKLDNLAAAPVPQQEWKADRTRSNV